MIKNYLLVAYRNILRNKTLSFVNIAGLSIGLTCVMLIMLFVKDELSFDEFLPGKAQIFRLVQTSTDTAGEERRSGNTGLPQGPAFAGDIPEVESFCRLKGWDMTTRKGNEGVEAKVLFTDTSFFHFFSATTIAGNPSTMLRNNNNIVVTEATAQKYFGTTDALGKTIELAVDTAFEPFIVTGIVQSFPVNSSIQFDMLIPFDKQFSSGAEKTERSDDWNSTFLNTFFKLSRGANAAVAQTKINRSFQLRQGKEHDSFKKEQGIVSFTYLLQPFTSMHLDERFFASNGLSNWSNSKYSYILSGIALLILIIACINFINITLAKSIRRNKEIGIRKTAGGSRRQIMIQFLTESFLLTLLSAIPAIILVQILLPAFNQLSWKHFTFSSLVKPDTLLLFGALIILISCLAGFYPAFIASRLQPTQTLYSRLKLNHKNRLGKSLVVVQFVIAFLLIIGTVVFHRQYNYMTTSDLGYKTDNVIRVNFPWGKSAQLQLIKNGLSAEKSIQLVAAKGGDWNKTGFTVNGKKTGWTYYEEMDDHYLQALSIPLVEGRYLSYTRVADTVSNCLVNQAFADKFLDKSISPLGQLITRNNINYTVVGVVRDYHSNSFKEQIEPVFYSLDKRGNLYSMYVKYNSGQAAQAIAAITKQYKALLPYTLLDYSFLEDWYNTNYYESEANWKKMVTSAAAVAILIACLGLFALAALSVEQRTKEIGVRKILGASVSTIVNLLSKDFLRLIFIAFLIAIPISWWLADKWLQDFAYRTKIGVALFAVCGLVTVLIALATISFQTIKAAMANPVKNLRTE